MTRILIIALIVTNLVFIFLLIDRSVTIDHLQMEITNMNESIQLIKSISFDLVENKTKMHIIKILNEKYSNNIVKEDDINKDIVYVDNVVLRFKNDLLISIDYQ